MGRRKTQEEYLEEVHIINPTIKVEGLYINGNSRMKCICLKCNYTWNTSARSMIKNKKCLNCHHNRLKKEEINLTHDEFILKVKECNSHIKVTGKYKSGMNTITCICLDCGHKTRIRCNSLIKSYVCKMCENGKENVTIGINDIHTTNPVLGTMLLYYEDGFKYTVNSRNKVDFKCPNCGNIIHNKTITNVQRRGLTCKCSDGVSFPEKYTYSVLSQICDSVETEKILNNYNKYRYDFYGTIGSNCWIVEVNGKQHKTKSFESCGGRTLQEEKENDKNKYEFAIKNKIDYYISLDAADTCYANMKNIIIYSQLSELYDLSNIDWDKSYKDALSSNVVKVCHTWNDGKHGVLEIANMFNLSRSTVRRYLKKGNSIKLCKYDQNESGKRKVLCLNTNEIFNSLREAEIKYNIKRGYISGYLKGKNTLNVGTHNDKKLKWSYL